MISLGQLGEAWTVGESRRAVQGHNETLGLCQHAPVQLRRHPDNASSAQVPTGPKLHTRWTIPTNAALNCDPNQPTQHSTVPNPNQPTQHSTVPTNRRSTPLCQILEQGNIAHKVKKKSVILSIASAWLLKPFYGIEVAYTTSALIPSATSLEHFSSYLYCWNLSAQFLRQTTKPPAPNPRGCNSNLLVG